MESAQAQWLDQLSTATHYNQWIFSQLQPHLQGRVLEVGCGTGNFTTLLAASCSEVVAVDLNPVFVQRAIARLKSQPHVSIRVADATTQPWPQAFDTIILLDVLEHIDDDVSLLRRLRHSLTANGQLMLKVPAIAALYNGLDQAVGHHRRYSRQTLQTVLSQAGFATSELWSFNLAGIPGWWLNGSVLQRQAPPGQQVGWFDRCVPLFQAIESRLACPLGLSLFAVARP